jgi:putative N6-adenine-specific DNA methylase
MSPEPEKLTPRGLERRIKRRLLSAECQFFAVCTPRLEKICAAELAALPTATITNVVTGGIEFSGPFDLVYETNLCLRTAQRILLRIGDLKACSYPELYNKCRRIPWEVYIGFDTMVKFNITAKKSRLHHAGTIAKTLFDAARDHMQTLGIELHQDDDSPLCFFVRFADDECTLSVDASGEALYKRGYHGAAAIAPIRETIAAALLIAADWQNYPCIVDPLCGSGTFVIEAALMAAGVLPGAQRHFAFEHWPAFGTARYEYSRAQTLARAPARRVVKCIGSDLNERALAAAQANALAAQVDKEINFTKADCRQFNSDRSLKPPGLIIANFPFGKRIGTDASVVKLFTEFGDRIRATCKGWRFGIVCARDEHIKAAGLKIDEKIPFSTGGLPVAFYRGKI